MNVLINLVRILSQCIHTYHSSHCDTLNTLKCCQLYFNRAERKKKAQTWEPAFKSWLCHLLGHLFSFSKFICKTVITLALNTSFLPCSYTPSSPML